MRRGQDEVSPPLNIQTSTLVLPCLPVCHPEFISELTIYDLYSTLIIHLPIYWLKRGSDSVYYKAGTGQCWGTNHIKGKMEPAADL